MPYTWATPTTWTDDPLSAGELNRQLVNNLRAYGDAWQPYTVALSGWTLGNGLLEGWFQKVGRTCRGRIEYTVGSSDTKSGAPFFSFPPVLPTTSWEGACVGNAGLYDGASREFRDVLYSTSGGGTMAISSQADVRLTPTVPWTWGTGDQMLLMFRYEARS